MLTNASPRVEPLARAGSGRQTSKRPDASRSRLGRVLRRAERRARVADVHETALAMPYVTVVEIKSGRPVYQVGGKSFVFFRNPRPDAFDPTTGERYDDVIVLWVAS